MLHKEQQELNLLSSKYALRFNSHWITLVQGVVNAANVESYHPACGACSLGHAIGGCGKEETQFMDVDCRCLLSGERSEHFLR